MKKIYLILFASLFIVLNLSFLMAEIQFSQTKNNLGNGTISNRLVLGYSKNKFGVVVPFGNTQCNNLFLLLLFPSLCSNPAITSVSPSDYITGNNPFEMYIQYNIYPKTFNSNNPNFKIDYCNFKLQYWASLENTPITLFEQNYTDKDEDINKAQYFFRMFDGDLAIGQETCYYENQSFDELILPMEMTMVTPTNQCKSCQYFLWSKLERDVSKAKSIGDNVSQISSFIQKIILLNFEIALALFWISLILIIFIVIGLIFLVGYWVFLWLWKVMN